MGILDELRLKNQERSVEWFGHELSEDDLLFSATALGGEGGFTVEKVLQMWSRRKGN